MAHNNHTLRLTDGCFLNARNTLSTSRRFFSKSITNRKYALALFTLACLFNIHVASATALLDFHYDNFELSTTTSWIDGGAYNPPSKPIGTIEASYLSGHALESIPYLHSTRADSNAASARAYTRTDIFNDQIMIDLVSNLDDDAIGSTISSSNTALSLWNTLFSVTGDGGSIKITGWMLNDTYRKNLVALYDITAQTLDLFDSHTSNIDLIDGHAYALSAISEQIFSGVDDATITGLQFNSVTIGTGSTQPPYDISAMNNAELNACFTVSDFDRYYFGSTTVPEPGILSIFFIGLVFIGIFSRSSPCHSNQ